MALITAPTTIPNLEYEFHTITVDTIGQDSANTFTAHLMQPLKNVVQARLLAAHIHSNVSTEHVYVSIDELNSIFSDRASNVSTGQGSISTVRGSFASLVTSDGVHAGTDALVHFTDNYPVVTQYIDPIRRLDRLTVRLLDHNGNTIKNSSLSVANNFLVLRFTCRKMNV